MNRKDMIKYLMDESPWLLPEERKYHERKLKAVKLRDIVCQYEHAQEFAAKCKLYGVKWPCETPEEALYTIRMLEVWPAKAERLSSSEVYMFTHVTPKVPVDAIYQYEGDSTYNKVMAQLF